MSEEGKALGALAQAREAVADRLDREAGWYDPLYALLVGAMVGAHAAPFPFGTVGAGVLLLALWGGYLLQERRSGVRLWGVTPKRARWVAFGVGAMCLCLMLSAVWLRLQGHGLLAAILTGSVGAVVAFVGSRLWRRIFRAELRRGA